MPDVMGDEGDAQSKSMRRDHRVFHSDGGSGVEERGGDLSVTLGGLAVVGCDGQYVEEAVTETPQLAVRPACETELDLSHDDRARTDVGWAQLTEMFFDQSGTDSPRVILWQSGPDRSISPLVIFSCRIFQEVGMSYSIRK